MAASDTNPSPDPPAAGQLACLSARELMERIEEEISRAARQGTTLSCLLITISNLEELAREVG